MRRFGLIAILVPLTALVLAPFAPVAGDDPVPVPVPIKRPRPPVVGPTTTTTSTLVSDEEALKQAGLTASEAGPLLDYLKARTLTDADQNKIGDIIKKFGADDFEVRVKAAEEVERFGPAAIGPLKTAERDSDPEVAYRARQALKRMEKVPHSQVSAAAIRAVVRLKPKDGAAVLIAFLPMADTEEVAEEIRTGLTALAVGDDGKPEPALMSALEDKSVVRRSAACVALIEGGNHAERVRIPEAFEKVKTAVRKETDTDAQFRGLWALLMTSRDKEFVPDLINMVPKLPRGRIWQLEEFLLQLAGDSKPDVRFGKSDEQLTKARDAWAAWWTKTGSAKDLVKFEFEPRITGYTDIIEYDARGYGGSRIVTLGPDLKEKARVTGTGINQLNYPTDVRKLPSGNYLVAEMNGSRVTERDSTGKTLKTTNIATPLSLDLLPDGGVVIVCRNQVVQYDKDMKQVWAYQRQQYDIMSGRRLPGGDIVFVTNQPQGNCFRLAAKDGKEVGKAVTLGRVQQYQSIDATGDDKIMVCEFNRVAEYDLKTGKEVWKYDTNNPTSCQRLPNGNTLITLINAAPGGRVIEVEPNGDIVWEYESKDGQRAARALRR
jgi:outer membrane protein assembly factor BamB